MVWTPVLCIFWVSALGLACCSEQVIRNQDTRQGHAGAHGSVEPSRNLPGKSKRSGDGWYTWPKGYQPQEAAYTAPLNDFQKTSNRILKNHWDQISQQSQGQRPTTQLKQIPESLWVQTSQPIQPLSTAESKALDEQWRKQWQETLQKINEDGKMPREEVRNTLEGFIKEQWPEISQKIPDGGDILTDFQKQSDEFLSNHWPRILLKVQDHQSQEKPTQQNRGQSENVQPSQKPQDNKLPNTEIQSVSEDFLKNHWPKILQELQEQTEAIHKEQKGNNNFFGNQGQAQNLQRYNGASNAENQKINNQNFNNPGQPALQGTNEQGQQTTRVQQQNYQSLQNVNWQLRTQENRNRGEKQSDERQQTSNNAAGKTQQQTSYNFNRNEQIPIQNAKDATRQILSQQWQKIAEDSANNRPKEGRQETPSESQRAPRPILTKHHKIELWTQEIPEPVEVKVEKEVPYPVPVVEERPVPYPVEKPYPVVIEKKVSVPVAVHVPYPVPVYKEVHVPVALTEERLVPVKVQKTVPVLFEKKEFYTIQKKQPEAESVEVIKSYQVPVSEEWKQASLPRPNKAEEKADNQGSVEYRGQIVAPYRGRLSQKVPLLFREQESRQGLESRRPNKGNGIDYYRVFEEPDALPNGREQNQARKTNGYTWQNARSYIDFLQSAKRVKRSQLEE